ncbi:MAG: hypothetical protein M9942_01650 [Microthrixaceae bacterium]|nr:hypothetical protein [Microthrixaceae bacterium]
MRDAEEQCQTSDFAWESSEIVTSVRSNADGQLGISVLIEESVSRSEGVWLAQRSVKSTPTRGSRQQAAAYELQAVLSADSLLIRRADENEWLRTQMPADSAEDGDLELTVPQCPFWPDVLNGVAWRTSEVVDDDSRIGREVTLSGSANEQLTVHLADDGTVGSVDFHVPASSPHSLGTEMAYSGHSTAPIDMPDIKQVRDASWLEVQLLLASDFAG